jgi:hypothetical protein
MWIDLAVIAMVLGSAYWVSYPMLRSKKIGISGESCLEEGLLDLEIQKEEVYAAIKEMEFDHKMGKLSKEDYQTLRDKYTTKAVGSLREIEALEREGNRSRDIESEIEKEILTLRQEGPGGRIKNEKVSFCTQCGRRASPRDRFCSQCGKRLNQS